MDLVHIGQIVHQSALMLVARKDSGVRALNDLQGRRVVGSGGVTGAIPAGTFSADRIIADLDARTVTLDGHARLLMSPGKLRMP